MILKGSARYLCPIHKTWTKKPLGNATERFCSMCDLEKRKQLAEEAKNNPLAKPNIKIGIF